MRPEQWNRVFSDHMCFRSFRLYEALKPNQLPVLPHPHRLVRNYTSHTQVLVVTSRFVRLALTTTWEELLLNDMFADVTHTEGHTAYYTQYSTVGFPSALLESWRQLIVSLSPPWHVGLVLIAASNSCWQTVSSTYSTFVMHFHWNTNTFKGFHQRGADAAWRSGPPYVWLALKQDWRLRNPLFWTTQPCQNQYHHSITTSLPICSSGRRRWQYNSVEILK